MNLWFKAFQFSIKLINTAIILLRLFLFPNYFNLAKLHSRKCSFMTFWSYTGTAAGINSNLNFWQFCFKNKCIADNTDSSAKAHKFNFLKVAQSCNIVSKFHRTERWLIKNAAVPYFQFTRNLPSVTTFNAVQNWKILSFLSFKIIFLVSVACEHNGFASGTGLCDFFCNIRHDCHSFFCSKGTVYKIILHVDYN